LTSWKEDDEFSFRLEVFSAAESQHACDDQCNRPNDEGADQLRVALLGHVRYSPIL
jgi:hypothetical protein